MHTTSLQFSKLLVEKMGGVKVEPRFWWILGRIDQPDKTKWELCLWADTYAKENIPAYLLSDLPAVFAAVGEEQGWGTQHISINNSPIGEQGMKHHKECIKCVPISWFHFLRFCETFAQEKNQESWNKAEEEATKLFQ